MPDYREEFDRTWKMGRYLLGGAVLGVAIGLGSLFYEKSKMENPYDSIKQVTEFYEWERKYYGGQLPIEHPEGAFLGLGVMAASMMVGSLGSLISRHIRDKKLKNLDEITPSSF